MGTPVLVSKGQVSSECPTDTNVLSHWFSSDCLGDMIVNSFNLNEEEKCYDKDKCIHITCSLFFQN